MKVWLAIILSILAFIIVVEFFYSFNNQSEINFRLSSLFKEDGKAGYILKPNASTADLPDWNKKRGSYDKISHGLGFLISTNSAGYRGKLYPVERQPDTIRILVVGESTTWGCFNDDDGTWPYFLEKILQEKTGKKVEVINAGVGGYVSAQTLEMVRRKFQFYKPDILLIGCWFNDIYIRGGGYYRGIPLPDTDYHVVIKKYKEKRPIQSKTLKLLYTAFCNFKAHARFLLTTTSEYRNELKKPSKSFFEKYYAGNKMWINDYRGNIDEIIAAIKSRQPSADYFIVAMPTFFAPDSPDKFEEMIKLPDHDIYMYHRPYLAKDLSSKFLFALYYYHTVLFQEFLEKKGYNLILGYTALGNISMEERHKYFTDEMHLTAEGNYLLAKKVAEELLNKKMDCF